MYNKEKDIKMSLIKKENKIGIINRVKYASNIT